MRENSLTHITLRQMPLKILQESNVEIIAKREMASQSYSDQTSTQLFHKGTIFMVKQLI